MSNLNVTGLNPTVARKITPMVEDVIRQHAANIHSFHVVGSAVISDYNEKLSDINSLVLLHTMDLRFLSSLAPLGKKYGKMHIAAPLVLTPNYIRQSLDTFPIEFLDMKLIHETVFGNDLLKDLQIARNHLRLQCEREIKTKLIHVRQSYISAAGSKKQLAATLVRSITGSMALFRAIIFLLGKEPPIPRDEVITILSAATAIDTGIFRKLLKLKSGLLKASEQELHTFFEHYYHALESTGEIINDLPVYRVLHSALPELIHLCVYIGSLDTGTSCGTS